MLFSTGLLLAQVVAPTLQPSPVKLPASAPVRRRAPAARPVPAPPPAPLRPETGAAPHASQPLPLVQGLRRYSTAQLSAILRPCLAEPAPAARLDACAARLTARLVADGYINSRVYPRAEPAPAGSLLVVEGRLVEVRVRSSDARLQRRLQRLVLPLQGQVVNLPGLQRQLDQLERLPEVGAISSRLNRLGGDISQASLLIEADPAPRRLRGDITLRNDGDSTSGQFRAQAALAGGDLLRPGDDLLLVGELDSDSQPELGYSQGSISYGLPLAEGVRLTTALASSRTTPLDRQPQDPGRSDRQTQLLSELEATLWEGLAGRVGAFVGLSLNRNTPEGSGRGRIPGSIATLQDRLSSAYLRSGFNLDASAGAADLQASVYALQGITAFTAARDLRTLDQHHRNLAEARALAADLDIAWSLAPRWELQLRAAGQLALNPLIEPMGFSLGSDSGLRGLPGQVVSGDSGLLGYGELGWQLWRQGRRELQLVPFLGGGWVTSTRRGRTPSARVGAGGLLLRWLQGRHWLLEVGWASQFGKDPGGNTPNWLIDNGLYTKVGYSF